MVLRRRFTESKEKIGDEEFEEERERKGSMASKADLPSDANVSAKNKSDWCGGHSRSREPGQVRWQRDGVTMLELRGEGVCRSCRSEVGGRYDESRSQCYSLGQRQQVQGGECAKKRA